MSTAELFTSNRFDDYRIPQTRSTSPPEDARGERDTVQGILDATKTGGDAVAMDYAAHVAGADPTLASGSVQGVAAMAFGLFGLPRADILVGPDNQFVAEAKRILCWRVGIDMFAGSTGSLILANAKPGPEMVTVDLVAQAEHGYNSPVWLVADDRAIAEAVLARVPELIADLLELNGQNAEAAWRNVGR